MTTPHHETPKPELLVVETSRVIRNACAAHCRELGMCVSVADDVAFALASVCSVKPTAIVTALELTSIPGTSLVAALRDSPRHRAIPIAVMTSSADAIPRLRASQVDGVLLKDASLLAELTRFFETIGLPITPEAVPKAPIRLDDARILIAEDSKTNSAILGRMLHVSGADVVCVTNGAEALTEVGVRPFDLILMDIEMPVMDGRDATRALRRVDEAIPIVALTAHDPVAFGDEARELGFSGIIHKPTTRETLVETCAHHLAESRGQAPAA